MSERSPVTYCGRAKLLSLLDEKFGVFFISQSQGSLELHFCEEMPRGHWVQIESVPRVYVDTRTFKRLGLNQAIDYDFNAEEFIIRKENVIPITA